MATPLFEVAAAVQFPLMMEEQKLVFGRERFHAMCASVCGVL
jgi:hypothetical protein